MSQYGIPETQVVADGGRCLNLGSPTQWWCRLEMPGTPAVLRYGYTARTCVDQAADELERQGRHEIDGDTRSAIVTGIRIGLLDRVRSDAETYAGDDGDCDVRDEARPRPDDG